MYDFFSTYSLCLNQCRYADHYFCCCFANKWSPLFKTFKLHNGNNSKNEVLDKRLSDNRYGYILINLYLKACYSLMFLLVHHTFPLYLKLSSPKTYRLIHSVRILFIIAIWFTWGLLFTSRIVRQIIRFEVIRKVPTAVWRLWVDFSAACWKRILSVEMNVITDTSRTARWIISASNIVLRRRHSSMI